MKPVHVRNVLSTCLRNIGLNPDHYGTHSFRIGRATDQFKQGYSVERIKREGRWESDAVYKYLRD